MFSLHIKRVVTFCLVSTTHYDAKARAIAERLR